MTALDPTFRIQAYEFAKELAHENSQSWNKTGTTHPGIRELIS